MGSFLRLITQNFPGHEAGLMVFILHTNGLDQISFFVLGPEFFGFPVFVVGNERRGGFNNMAGRTIVLLELYDFRLGKIFFKRKYIGDIRAAPAVNGLILIPY